MNELQARAYEGLKAGLNGLTHARLELDNGMVEVGVQDGRRYVIGLSGRVRQER